MDKEKLLNQANYLLRKILKHRSTGWHTCPQEEDLLTQEIELYLKQFLPKDKRNKYRQSDVTDLIEQILKEKQ